MLHHVEVELQSAAVERPRLPKDEEDVAQEGGRHRADRAERDRAPRVGEVARQVGALHHPDHRREDERKHVRQSDSKAS